MVELKNTVCNKTFLTGEKKVVTTDLMANLLKRKKNSVIELIIQIIAILSLKSVVKTISYT